MKTVIRFLTQHFYPDPASTGNLLTDLATGLAEKGYNIEVYTSQPLHDIKAKAPKYEVYKNVKIHRLISSRLSKNTKFGKVYNFSTFFAKTFLKVLFTSNKKNYYLYFIVSNPPFLPLIGSFLSYVKKIDFIHLLYDIQPDEAIAVNYVSGRNVFIKLWAWLNKFIYKKAAHIIVLSEQMVETVKLKMEKAKAPENSFNNISVIDNWANGDHLHPIDYDKNLFIKQNNLEGKFIINYCGNLGAFQKFESLMKVAEILRDEDIAFLYIGDGIKKKGMMKEKEEKGLKNVYFFPYQDKKKLPQIQAASHLSVVHLIKEIEGLAFPSKTYSILASGTPVLALCQDYSSLKNIITKANCGFAREDGDVQGIIDAIKELKNNPGKIIKFGRNARKFFEENYTLEISVNKYEKLFKTFIDKNS